MAVNPNDAVFVRGNGTRRRPPIVRFSRRARFDRVLTDRNGRSSYIDEDVVNIANPGGGVALEKPVDQWFKEIEHKPEYAAWIHGYRQMYRDWKESHDPAKVDGTHISNWPLLSPGQVENLLAADVKTIEQVASMSDEIAIGIDGGAYIRSKARYWINAAADIGAVTAEVASLRADNETLRAAIAHKDQQLDELKAEVKRLTDYFTGKEGFDVVAGRVQPAGLQSVQAAGPRGAAPQAIAAPPSVAAQLPMPEHVVLSYEDAASLEMSELREYCYERNIKPAATADKTLEALLAAGEISKPKETPPAAEEAEKGRTKRK